MHKANFTINEHRFEITYMIEPNIGYIRRTGDYSMLDAGPDDWDWDIEEIICLDTGCPVDMGQLDHDNLAALVKDFRDNFDPTPYE